MNQPAPSAGPVPVQSRMSYVAPSLDVGEQIVGSSHLFEIAAPFNGATGNATLSASIGENEAFSIESIPDYLAPINNTTSADVLQDQLAKKIRVRFAPARASHDFEAKLTITATWADGAKETRLVTLLGAARELASPPSPSRDERAKAERDLAQQSAAEEQLARDKRAYDADRHDHREPPWAHDHFEDFSARAHDAAVAIARAQKDGIDEVIQKIGTYVPPPAPPNLWWDLAKAAIVIGSGGLTGIILKKVAENVAVSFGAAAASPRASSIASSVNGWITKNIATALQGKPAVESTQPNARVAFFESQTNAFETISYANQTSILDFHDTHRQDLVGDPEGTVNGMKAIAAGFQGAVPHAHEIQAHASGVEWLAYKSRLELGVDHLDDGSSVTELKKTRTSRHPTPDGFKGLLDIIVDLEHGPPHVAGARAPGIARALVGDIAASQLSESRVPMRIIVGWNEPEPTIITRDESGRLRIAGNFERLSPVLETDGHVRSEAEAERAARILVDIALSRSLRDWGVEIATDDHSENK